MDVFELFVRFKMVYKFTKKIKLPLGLDRYDVIVKYKTLKYFSTSNENYCFKQIAIEKCINQISHFNQSAKQFIINFLCTYY